MESYGQGGTTIQHGNGMYENMAIQNGTSPPKPELLLFSANTPASLNEQIRRHLDWLHLNQESCTDMAYTRAMHREHLPHRAFAILDQSDFIETASGSKAPPVAPEVIMIFSGQGSQWPEMGKELILNDPSFRNDIMKMDQVLKTLSRPPHWNMMSGLK